MHKVRVLAAACGLSLLASQAVGAAELKIGFVNVGKVFDSYEKTKALDARLGQKGKQKEGELQGQLDALKKAQEGLELLSEEARAAKKKQLEEQAEEIQRFRAHTARDLRYERDEMAKQILGEIQKAIEDYAKTNGFSVIIDSRSLIYAQAAYDATDGVLQLLNSKAKTAAKP